MNLCYNIDFEIAAAIFDMVLWICMNYFFTTNSSVSRSFRDMVMWTMITIVFDIISALTISYGVIVPLGINKILTTVFFLCSVAFGYSFYRYIGAYITDNKRKAWTAIFSRVALSIVGILLVANLRLGLVFSFNKEDGYVRGPLYILMVIFPICFIAIAVVVALLNKEFFALRQIVSIGIFSLLVIIGDVIQVFIMPSTLIVFFFISVGIWVLFLTMENPDYIIFIDAVNSLKSDNLKSRELTKNALSVYEANKALVKTIIGELKKPINKINAHSQRILAKTANQDILNDADKIIDNVKKIKDTLNEIDDYIGLSDDEIKLDIKEYSPKEMFRECADNVRYDLAGKNVDFQCDIDDKLPKKLFGDRDRISQIISSILFNAIKFTQAGSIKLKALWKQLDADKGKMSVEVTDTGVGMRPEEVDYLEKSINSGVAGANKMAKGRGLGLNIASRLLALMGSKLHLKSEYGKGSSFSFDIEQGINKPIEVEAINLGKISDEDLDLDEKSQDASKGEESLSKTEDKVEKILSRPNLNQDILKEKLEEVRLSKEKKERTPIVIKEKEIKYEKAKITKKILPKEVGLQKQKEAKLVYGDIIKFQNGLHNFDVEVGLKYCMNDAKFYRDMLNTYVENEKLGDLLTYLKLEDWESFMITLRSISNTSQTIGALELSREAKSLELSYKNDDKKDYTEKAKHFIDSYRKTINIIRNFNEEDEKNG